MGKFTITHTHNGVPLLVQGVRDADECTITRVSAADSQIDLFDLFDSEVLDQMAQRLDAQLAAEACQDNDEARADRVLLAYEFRAAA